MKFLLSLLTVFCTFNTMLAQDVNTENILILRDEFGVPYIYSKTDAEAAYALAWVQCEDNF